MRRSKLLSSLFLSLALAGLPSSAFAKSQKDESQGTMQTDAQSKISEAQQQLDSLKTKGTAQEIKKAGDSCNRALEDGKNECLESRSSFTQQMSSMIPGVMTAMAGAAGSAEKCRIMQAAGQALSGLQGNYNNACGAKKNACTKTCSDSSQKVADAQPKCRIEADSLYPGPSPDQKLLADAEALKCENAAKANQDAISLQGMPACDDLQANADAGKGNEGDLAKGNNNSAQCQEDTVDCVKDPKNPKCPHKIDCNDPEDAKKEPQCICELNPRSKGCSGNTQYTSTNPLGTESATAADEPTGGGSPQGQDSSPAADQPANSSLPAAAGGGGEGGLSGQGKDSSVAEKKDKKQDGGGGEYGGGGGGFGAAGASDPYGKYAAYLPGAKNRSPKSQSDSAQLTGSNGLTNWEKVNNRYRDNKPTFLDK